MAQSFSLPACEFARLAPSPCGLDSIVAREHRQKPDPDDVMQAQPANPDRRNLLKGAGLVGAAALGGNGTLIAQQGAEPAQSRIREALEVLWGFCHEAPNLGILGASVMGTSGARNPTLTAQALAWRTADYLANNWSAVAE